jgi:hypothetical protein
MFCGSWSDVKLARVLMNVDEMNENPRTAVTQAASSNPCKHSRHTIESAPAALNAFERVGRTYSQIDWINGLSSSGWLAE